MVLIETQPATSLIVPIFNLAGYIGGCIESIRQQTLRDFEAILIDDGSTDQSLAEAVVAVDGDSRFRLISKSNEGLSVARNIGLAIARGTYICFVDGDDRIHPQFLEKMLQALVETNSSWVSCGVVYTEFGKDRGPTHSSIHDSPKPKEDSSISKRVFSDWADIINHFPSAWNKLYRRDLIAELQFRPGAVFEDHEFYLSLAQKAKSMASIDLCLYLQTRNRPNQITNLSDATVFKQFETLNHIRRLMLSSAIPGAQKAYERLAVRLIFERGAIIQSRAMIGRYFAKAREFFKDFGIEWRQVVGDEIDRRSAILMQGEMSFSIIIPTNGNLNLLIQSLTSLAGQKYENYEVIITCDRHMNIQGVLSDPLIRTLGPTTTIVPENDLESELVSKHIRLAKARNRALKAAIGRYVIFLDSGDTMRDTALFEWITLLCQTNAQVLCAAHFIGAADAGYHSGTHDQASYAPLPEYNCGQFNEEQIYNIHSFPSSKAFERSFLVTQNLQFPDHSAQTAQFIFKAISDGERITYSRRAVTYMNTQLSARQIWSEQPDLTALRSAVETLIRDLPVKSDSWCARLFMRAVWEKFHFGSFENAVTRHNFFADAIKSLESDRHDAPLQEWFDPYMSQHFRALVDAIFVRKLDGFDLLSQSSSPE